MENIVAKLRVKKSVHSAKAERRNGMVPGVLYGKNINNYLFEIGDMELEKRVSKIGDHGVVNLDLNGEKHTALIKEVQRDTVNRKLIHIDLEEITDDTVVETEVPLLFNGEENLSSQGYILQKEKGHVKIQCNGNNIPKNINVNVSNLKIGDVYKIGDIEVSKELTFLENMNAVIASVSKANSNINDQDDSNNSDED